MQPSQTGPHFKLEEVWFCKDIFSVLTIYEYLADLTRMFGPVRGSEKSNEGWKGIFYLLN